MKILLTKVRPPQRRKDVLRRVRLVDTLHQNLHRKLTFVSAPAGYGKTTLLVDFADDVDADVYWYLIGPDDNDFGQFVRHIVAAFQQKNPEFGREIEQSFSAPGASPDPASVAIDLINEIEEQLDDFSLLVLDDYHLAGENEQIVDFIENLLEHLPDQLRILMGSRSVYGIPTANLYIRDELITIGAEELRFRAEELQRLVSQNYHVRLSQEQAEELAKRADGWIVAIMLAVRSMENGALPKFSGAMDQVYDFLAQEVVQRQREELRHFMLTTSVVDDFNEDLSNYLLDSDEASRLLRGLEDRNLFVNRTETNDGPSYRYHQLFAEFLQHQLETQDPERFRYLHSQAATWFKKQEQWELAIRHKLASGDLETAASWMDGVAYEYYTTGRQAQLTRWYESLEKDPELLKLAPILALYQAKTLINQSEFTEPEQLLEIAEGQLRQRGQSEALANTLVTRGWVARYTGRHQEAIRLAEEAQSILGEGELETPERHQYLQAQRLKGLAHYYTGNTPLALEMLSGAVTGLRSMVDDLNGASSQRYQYDLGQALSDIGLISISSGDPLEAQRAFREVLEIYSSRRSDNGALAIARNNIGYLYHQTGDYKDAWQEYQLGLENAEAAQRMRIQVGILNGRGDILRDLEEWDEAESSYQRAIEIGQQADLSQDLDVSYFGMADIERARGNFSKAQQWLREAASVQGETLDQSGYHIFQGRIYLDMGRNDLAHDQFRQALESLSEESKPTQDKVLANFYLAYSQYQEGKEESAATHFEKALKDAAVLGYDNFLIASARAYSELIEEMQSRLDSPQLASLIKDIGKFKTGKAILESKEAPVPAPSLHLEIHGFGPGEVRRDGELISVSEWRSSRAKALFFYIVDKQRVRKETIGLDFWPDFSAGKVSSNFHATLWRVRQALGNKDAIIFEDDHYLLHPSIDIWFDVREFSNYMDQADSEELSEIGQVSMLRQALQLYQGHFLEDIYMSWADERREELQEGYINALNQLADRERGTEQYREARKLYDRIIEVDPYQDQVHMAIMECLVAEGAPSAAKAHYVDYKELLHRELNAEPQPELQRYAQQISG